MQATMPKTMGRRERRSSRGGMGRAVKYLSRYRQQALLPYFFLIIATLSQLAVPRMVRNIIDAVTSGYLADQVLAALDGRGVGWNRRHGHGDFVFLCYLRTAKDIQGRSSQHQYA